jgi:hypothetical protein
MHIRRCYVYWYFSRSEHNPNEFLLGEPMLQTLLWCCPICSVQDSLTHRERWLKPDLIECPSCHSIWELSRVIGGPDFRMRLVSGNGKSIEKPLAVWYDQINERIKFIPLDHPSWPLPGISEPNEELYLHSPVVVGMAAPDDPIFQNSKEPIPPAGNGAMGFRPMGPGQLFFTSKRLIFLFADNKTLSSSWQDLRSADTLMDRAFSVGFENGMYVFVFKDQSVLKWLAYTHLMVKQSTNGHKSHVYLGYV